MVYEQTPKRHNEIKLCVQNVDNIVGSIVDMIGRVYGREDIVVYEHTSHSSNIKALK